MEMLQGLSDDELVACYGAVLRELKRRTIIRSKNVVGDLGEHVAIRYYCSTKGLPNLQAAPAGTKNVDALSKNGERYSIKATTAHTPSVFYGLNPPGTEGTEAPKFEHLIIVLFDQNMTVQRINELSWDVFLIYKRWHSRMTAWSLPITKELLDGTKTVFHAAGG